MFTTTLKEAHSIAAAPIMPSSLNGAQETGAVDMSKFNRIQFIGAVGTLGANATIDAYLQESNESNGANGTNIAGTAITQVNAANKAFTMEVRSDQLTKRYVKAVVTVGTAASVIACFPLATEGRYQPVDGNDVASVTNRKVASA